MSVGARDALPDSHLLAVARRAWDLAVIDFFHPPLPEPVIEHSPDASSFFYIDSSSWTVHLNTAGVPLYLGGPETEGFLRSVCHHEIQHYLLCPFDGVTSGMMFAGARRHLNNDLAMFVVNLFADLVVESSLLRRYPSLTHSRIMASIHESSLRMSEHSRLWKLIVACHRAMWGFPLPATAQVTSDDYAMAQEIVRIARQSIDNERRWPRACEKIAEAIAEWMPEDEELFDKGAEGAKSAVTVVDGGSGVFVPVDVDAVMGSPLENRNGDMARKCIPGAEQGGSDTERERLARLVNDRGGNLEDLEAVYILAGIGVEDREWVRFWYRAKASDIIRFDVRAPKLSGSLPVTPELWRLGDPVEELDVVQSLQAFPVLVPNMSTRRWQRMEPPGSSDSESLPDLLLVIDSSGSMTWRMSSKRVAGPYHTALVAAFAAMNFAVKNGRRIAAINFSDGTKTCDWSTERKEVERTLLTYQGGGTVAPVKSIEGMCNASESRVLAIVITDAEIVNWSHLIRSVSVLSRRGHRLVFFHIGSGSSSRDKKTHDSIRSAGAAVYGIKSPKDLPRLVVREVRSAYSS